MGSIYYRCALRRIRGYNDGMGGIAKMVRKIGIAFLVTFIILSTVYQLFDLYRFVNSGARFTLRDGQMLCARVQRLEAYTELVPEDCEFGGSK